MKGMLTKFVEEKQGLACCHVRLICINPDIAYCDNIFVAERIGHILLVLVFLFNVQAPWPW